MGKSIKFEEFMEKLIGMYGDTYDVLSEFKNMSTHIEVRHRICGYKWSILPSNLTASKFKGKVVCPRCNGKVQYSNEEWREKIRELAGDEFEMVGDYTNNATKFILKHNVCGYERPILPSDFIYKQGCPKCSDMLRYTTEAFKEKIYDLVGDEYSLIGESENNRSIVTIIHNDCGNEWETTPTSFVSQEERCPNCNDKCRSKGEKKIKDFLLGCGIKFIQEISFDDCKNIKPLPFDFAILGNKKNLKMLIEFDGKQHYEPVEHFGGEAGFTYRKHNDEIKNNYCKQNNILLLRIPYWDYENIEEILDRELKKFNTSYSFDNEYFSKAKRLSIDKSKKQIIKEDIPLVREEDIIWTRGHVSFNY